MNDETFAIYKQAAKGDAESQFELAKKYANGEGVNKDAAKAVEWWTEAVEQGDSYAQFHFGWCYDQGVETTKNATKAVEYYNKVVNNPNADEELIKEAKWMLDEVAR